MEGSTVGSSRRCFNYIRTLDIPPAVPREWPYPEEEKKPNKRGFGQYKPLKGHKHEKEKAIR
jgi:hypothetical protein